MTSIHGKKPPPSIEGGGSRPCGYPNGADLVIEVVSEGTENRRRDLEVKRAEYAEAGITEYWIVDPEPRTITVLTLEGKQYREHGVFAVNARATSVLLVGLEAPVSNVFAAGEAGQPAAK